MKCLVKKQWVKGAALASLLAVSSASAFAADPKQPSELNNSLAIVLLAVIVGLLLAIAILAYVVIGAGELYVQRYQEKQKKSCKDRC
jgi:cytochrome c oxidase cbb3-type subunit 3